MTKQIKHITYRNGVTLVYFVAFVNAIQQLVIAYGVHITPTEQASWALLLNAAIAVIARALNLPYKPSETTVPSAPVEAPAATPAPPA